MTSEPIASAPVGISRFGSDMANRVRPRTGRLRRREMHQFVGAVGRASLGFGRAVGRSSAIRPVVDATNLDTYSLRPPRGWWHAIDGEIGEVDEPAAPVMFDQRAPATGSRRPEIRRTPSWTTRLLPEATSARNAGARPSPRPRGRVTSAGASDAVQRATAAASTPDPTFVSTGDPRLDALRKVYAAGLTPKDLAGDREAIAAITGVGAVRADSQASRTSARRTPGASASLDGDAVRRTFRETPDRPGALGSDLTAPGSQLDAGRSDSASSVAATDDAGYAVSRDGRRGDTSAGRATGPGGLGRRVRPEPAMPVRGPDRTVLPATSPGGPVGAAAPNARTEPRSSATSDPAARTPRDAVRRTTSGQPLSAAEVDAMRRGLEVVNARRARGDDAQRAGNAPRPAQRPSRTNVASPSTAAGDPPARQSGQITQQSSAPPPSNGDAHAADSIRTTSTDVSNGSASNGSASKPNAHDGDVPTASIRRRVDGDIGRPDAPEPLRLATRDPLPGAVGLADVATVAPMVVTPAALPEHGSNLRLQRMIAAGRVPSQIEQIDQRGRRVPTVDRELSPTPGSAPRTSSVADPVDDPEFRRSNIATAVKPVAPERPHRVRRRIPTLPGRANGHDTVIRRLSIPRAMSAIHRPDGPLSASRVAPVATAVSRREVQDIDNRSDRVATVTGLPLGAIAPAATNTAEATNTPLTSTASASTIQRTPIAHHDVGSATEQVSAFEPATARGIDRVSIAPLRAARRESFEPAGDLASSSHQPQLRLVTTPGPQGDEPTRAPVRQHELRRQRISHLTNDWSLVKGSPGALSDAVRHTPTSGPAVRRAGARPSLLGEQSRARIAEPSRSPRSSTLHRVGDGIQRSSGDATIESADVDAGLQPVSRESVDHLQRRAADVAVAATPSVATRPDASGGNALADRFMTELTRSIRSRPAPLPTPFRPLADQITGGRKVMLSTDSATRKALRSVGKVAATTGDTIHLDPVATTAARMNHVLAHELTHIANPSPVARFFDDAVDSPEERRAEATAKIMTRSPLAPTSSILSAPGTVARRTAASGTSDIIRRSPAVASPGTISADSLAASITGTSHVRSSSSSTRSAPNDMVRRAWEPATPTLARPTAGPPAGSHREQTPSPTAEVERSRGFDPDSDEAREWFAEQLEKHADAIVRVLGDRLVTDLERRGGRMWGGI